MSKHTEGPWEVEQFHKKGEVDNELIVGCNGRLSIAEVHNHADTSETHGAQEARANGRLIAAAPELLATLRECLPDLKHYVATHGAGPDKRLERAEAAIAKATL